MAELILFLGSLAALVALAALARLAARRVRQPAVVGELVLGILLGPTLLGWAWPAGHALLLGGPNAPLLDALAWVGLVLFMLTAGAEMTWRPAEARPAVAVALGGLVVPATAGVVMATFTPMWFFDGAPTAARVAIVALVMTVTALPVLARILADLDLLGRPLATTALAAATIDDVVAWVVLAMVAGATAPGLTGSFAANLAVLGGLLAASLALDRFLAPRVARWKPADPSLPFALVVAAAFAAALLTHLAGLHAVVGALAVGAVVSRHPALRREVAQRFQGVAAVLLLPLFFVLTVGQADLRLVLGGPGIAALLIVLVAATAAKVLGAYGGARLAGVPAEAAFATGILMNARGAVGLVVAKVGYDAGLLAAHGFALLVLVIVLTTLFAAPALAWHARRYGTTDL